VVAARLAPVFVRIPQAFQVSLAAGHVGDAPVPGQPPEVRLPQTVDVPVQGGQEAHVQRLPFLKLVAFRHQIIATVLYVDHRLVTRYRAVPKPIFGATLLVRDLHQSERHRVHSCRRI